jgi:hypothetical protein
MRFDTFVHRFNHERPHQALAMQTPASRYLPSDRACGELKELEYPNHDWTAVMTACGRICYQRRKINVSQVFAGQRVGISRSTITSGSSHSCITTWGTSTTRRADWNRSIIPLARRCYPCARNKTSPIRPE